MLYGVISIATLIIGLFITAYWYSHSKYNIKHKFYENKWGESFENTNYILVTNDISTLEFKDKYEIVELSEAEMEKMIHYKLGALEEYVMGACQPTIYIKPNEYLDYCKRVNKYSSKREINTHINELTQIIWNCNNEELKVIFNSELERINQELNIKLSQGIVCTKAPWEDIDYKSTEKEIDDAMWALEKERYKFHKDEMNFLTMYRYEMFKMREYKDLLEKKKRILQKINSNED